MSRILVAFASSHGQTQAIADSLAARLRSRGHTVEAVDAEAGPPPSPLGFDAVVLGSRIQMGKHAASIARYAAAHRNILARLPTGFFSVSMSAAQAGAGADPNGYLARFFAAVDWTPTRATAFPGALRYRRYGFWLRQVMKLLSRAGGHPTDTSRDHFFTRWGAVDRFADELADQLPWVVPATEPRQPAPRAVP